MKSSLVSLRLRRAAALCLLLLLLAPVWAAIAADSPAKLPFLSPIFGDHMVVQRGKPNTFWGWTEPGATVRVTIGEQAAETRAGSDGKWTVQLAVPGPGQAFEVKVDGAEHVVLHDVLSGDVWLCGGQSNMAFPLIAADGGKDDAAAADYPELRLFHVANRSAYAPVAVPEGEWQVCTPTTAPRFSAVAFYFARRLQRELHIPIGLVEDCVGGSPAESWISAEELTKIGEFGPQIAKIEELHASGAPELGSFLMHWLAANDAGDKDAAWAQPGFDDAGWKSVDVPGAFAELGVPDTPSVCWFRREITLPDPVPAGQAKILLGVVEKMETTYVNGHWVGASSWVENPRNYRIPADVLRPGRNLVAVRVFKHRPDGGFLSNAGDLRVELGDGTSIPLAGKWQGKVSVDARPPFPMPLDFENYSTMPTVLYNGMIAPIEPLALTGALWYQGEANWTKPMQYRQLMPALIADWRAQFGQGDIPVYMVSLPKFNPHRDTPGFDGWTGIREALALTTRTVPNTGIAITIDTGDEHNIHPRTKVPVGERLAADALALHYGVKVPYAGPTYASMEKLPGALRLHFDHIDGGLEIHGDKLGEFSVAGADHVFHWATAKIDGDTIVVSAPDVPNPEAARYACQGYPEATLFNAAGLPAGPFRTDDWEMK
ncbi:MAG TPA: sialate O-acetylesterase [Opitutus sp.]|nr:sialate O-acetylesterase [Opitutus sp.]